MTRIGQPPTVYSGAKSAQERTFDKKTGAVTAQPICLYRNHYAPAAGLLRRKLEENSSRGTSMPEIAIRFGVSNGAGLRAATWKLWTVTTDGKFDVYLACRQLGGSMKASMHESGQWHIAYTKQTFETKVQGAIAQAKDRFIEKWTRPPEIAPGVTAAFRIVTPWTAVKTAIEAADVNKVTWLPKAPEGHAAEIYVFILKPCTEVSDCPGAKSMGMKAIGSFALVNGETVWAVWRHIPMPEIKTAGPGVGQFFKGMSMENLEDDDLRMLAFSTDPDGVTVLTDCAVQASKSGDGIELAT